MVLERTVMDMTVCAKKDSEHPGIYKMDLDGPGWFTVPDGEFRDAIVAHPNHMVCAYHKKKTVHLFHHADLCGPTISGEIIHAPGGYARWVKGVVQPELSYKTVAHFRGFART